MREPEEKPAAPKPDLFSADDQRERSVLLIHDFSAISVKYKLQHLQPRSRRVTYAHDVTTSETLKQWKVIWTPSKTST